MNPPVFTGSKVDESPQNFIQKILRVMHTSEMEMLLVSGMNSGSCLVVKGTSCKMG
uniref:Gag-pol polyprotein n=1 Tax=Solanum tuberosum TaxID=4113 RepID=M1AKS5_SOLTU